MTSGVQISVLRESSGRIVQAGDKIFVHYSGVLSSGGTPFDASFDFLAFTPKRNPFEFVLGSGQVIAGWESLQGRRIGDVLRLEIPAAEAYGSDARPGIPANSDLTFVVEIIAVKPAGSAPDAREIYARFSDVGIDNSTVAKIISYRKSFAKLVPPQSPSQKLGTDGADALTGTATANILIGLKGDDALKGDLGADLLIGGAGADRHIYSKVADSPVANGSEDRLIGFNAILGDRLDFTGFESEVTFVGKRRFSGVAGELRFRSGRVLFDADGDRKADMEILMPGAKGVDASAILI